MQLTRHLALLLRAEYDLDAALRRLADDHAAEPDVAEIARTLADLDARRRDDVALLAARYPHHDATTTGTTAGIASGEPAEPADDVPVVAGHGPLLVDLHAVHTLVSWLDLAYAMAGQGARALRDEDLRALSDRGVTDLTRHLRWLRGRINQAAAQTLVLG